MLEWKRVTYKDYQAFRIALCSDPRPYRKPWCKPVRGYLCVVNEGHVICQCSRVVIIRAEHPEELPGLFPLHTNNQRSTAQAFLREQGLDVPEPFPYILSGWWWEFEEGVAIDLVTSSDSE